MKNNIIIICLSLTFLFSCKDEKKADTAVENTENEFFRVELELKVKNNDNMHLYYTTDGSVNFDEQKSIWREVKGNEQFQKVIFDLPTDIYPSAIRFDLGYGLNESQSEVEINGFEASFYGRTIKATGSEFFNYFYNTKESSIRLEGTNKLQKLDKKQGVGPILYPNENFIAKLKSLTTK